ncbi:sensor histidine kinase [Clostridia bacterium OttesenSCG-928-O13]|nr:sensor histidine kinase [Clostridia bacterium OttesenSCG-928-O13]
MESKRKTGLLASRFGTIRAQLTFTFTVLIVVLVGSIILAVSLLYSQFTAQNNQITQNSLEIIGESVEGRINTLRKLMPIIRGDGALKSALASGADAETAARRMGTLYAYGLQHRYLVSTKGRVLDPIYENNVEQTENMLRLAGYYDFLESGKDEMFSAPHQFPFTSPEGERISYFYNLRDPDQYYKVDGHALLIVSIPSLFEERLELMHARFDDFYVIDGQGRVIFTLQGADTDPDTRLYATQNYAGFAQGAGTLHQGNLYFASALTSYPDWHMVGVVTSSQFTKSIRLTLLLVSLLGVLGVALVVLFSNSISRSIAQPVSTLNQAMAEFEQGNVPGQVELRPASGEMATLVSGFNHMLDSINAHLATIVREQEEKKTAEVTALQYQLQSLQNQINPHFLYNTLNIISFLALDGKSDEIRSFNQSLIALLRATLSNTQDTVTISHELSFLDAYVHIMEYRYPDMFEVEVVADESVLDCQIPKLILQPLVENAMLHGLFPTGEQGRILVLLEGAQDKVRVTVADDGVGMTQQQIECLLMPRKGFTSIGLTNVNERLMLCYGPGAALIISSEEHVGTNVTFEIPQRRDDDMPQEEDGEAWSDTRP